MNEFSYQQLVRHIESLQQNQLFSTAKNVSQKSFLDGQTMVADRCPTYAGKSFPSGFLESPEKIAFPGSYSKNKLFPVCFGFARIRGHSRRMGGGFPRVPAQPAGESREKRRENRRFPWQCFANPLGEVLKRLVSLLVLFKQLCSNCFRLLKIVVPSGFFPCELKEKKKKKEDLVFPCSNFFATITLHQCY